MKAEYALAVALWAPCGYFWSAVTGHRFGCRDLARGFRGNSIFFDAELELGDQSGASSPQSRFNPKCACGTLSYLVAFGMKFKNNSYKRIFI